MFAIQRLDCESNGCDVLVADPACCCPRAARHNSRLPRPTDHDRHRQPQGTQTEGRLLRRHNNYAIIARLTS